MPTGAITPEENLEIFDSPGEKMRDSNAALPFRIAGVDDGGAVYEAADVASPYDAEPLWMFGGDYSLIGSMPVSSQVVFGSGTDTPDNLQTYRAALIKSNGYEPIASLSKDPYYEPRDGTGTADALTWFSSTLNDAHEMGVNNWQLSFWKRGQKEARVLGSAEELNGVKDTPALPGELVPTMNNSSVYYASNVKDGDTWNPSILAYAIDGSDGGRIVDAGSFPAAVDSGVLYATDQVETDDMMLGYSSIAFNDGAESRAVLSVNSAASNWCVSGVWAADGLRVASFSNAKEDKGCYIGIWLGDFERSVAWVHVKSPSIVGTISCDSFAWGAGSQEENAQMYMLNVSNPGQIRLLGEAPGYARPALSSDGSSVLVPVYNGLDAVRFKLVPLG